MLGSRNKRLTLGNVMAQLQKSDNDSKIWNEKIKSYARLMKSYIVHPE